MLKHKTLATVAAAVMFIYVIFCGLITALAPDFSFRIYALAFHGIKLVNLQASILSVPEMLIGATFNAAMVWILVCATGWIYEMVTKRK